MFLYLALLKITLTQFIIVCARYEISHQSVERIIPKGSLPFLYTLGLGGASSDPIYLKCLTLKC